MGVTNFPNGMSSEGTVVQHGLSSITGAGTVTTSLDTITSVHCTLAGVPGTAGGSVAFVQGTAHANSAGAASFIARTYQYDAVTAGTVAINVAWTAVGTKS